MPSGVANALLRGSGGRSQSEGFDRSHVLGKSDLDRDKKWPRCVTGKVICELCTYSLSFMFMCCLVPS